MSKIKISGRELKARYEYIYQVGYCDLDPFFKKVDDPMFYNCGVYGWNYDVYYLGSGVAITTGYRDMIGLCIDYNFKKWINEKAQSVEYKTQEAFDLEKLFIDSLKNGIVIDNTVYCGLTRVECIQNADKTYSIKLYSPYGEDILEKTYKKQGNALKQVLLINDKILKKVLTNKRNVL